MTDLLRLVLWLRTATGWTLLAVLLGLATVATNTGLLGVATYLISAAALHPPLLALAGALSLVRLFGISRAFVRYAERLVSHDVTFRLVARLRLWLFGRLVRLAPGQLLALDSADLLARLVRDVDEAQTVFQHLVGPLVIAVLTLVLVGGGFWSIDAQLGMVVSASLLVVGFGLPLLSALASRRLHLDQVRQRAELDVRVADTLYGLPDLLAFGQAGVHLETTVQLGAAIRRLELRLANLAGVRLAAQDATVRLGAWIVLLLAIPLVASQVLGSTYLAVLPIVLLGAAEAFEPLTQAAQRVAATRAASARIWAIADRRPSLVFPAADGENPCGDILEFEQVGFTYDDLPVLTDVSFTLRRGQAIGIVGPSGAGKTSLLQLAVRAWDPTSGNIRLDGRDLRILSAEALTSTIGLLTHDSYILSASLRENLKLARPSATETDMRLALDDVGLADLVGELPDGLDTWLGEQGARLSGGERQRLALARMLLIDAPFLLFDEPTANLDLVTERAIMRGIQGASRARGVLLVTHRLVDLDWLDELLVLDAGHIVERGRPADLRGSGGLYARMLHIQDELLIECATAPM